MQIQIAPNFASGVDQSTSVLRPANQGIPEGQELIKRHLPTAISNTRAARCHEWLMDKKQCWTPGIGRLLTDFPEMQYFQPSALEAENNHSVCDLAICYCDHLKELDTDISTGASEFGSVEEVHACSSVTEMPMNYQLQGLDRYGRNSFGRQFTNAVYLEPLTLPTLHGNDQPSRCLQLTIVKPNISSNAHASWPPVPGMPLWPYYELDPPTSTLMVPRISSSVLKIRACYIFILLGVFSIVGSLASALWRSIDRDDISGGFSLAQYILGVGVFVIGCMVAIHSKTCTCWT